MGKKIGSYLIEKYKSGIVSLLINTINKNEYYHRYNDNEFLIGDNETEDYELFKTEEITNILNNKMMYRVFESQNKDQIRFLWIPITLICDLPYFVEKYKNIKI